MRPLEGIRVLDLSRVLAGPFAGRMLSDLGADVVKVEAPGGDVTRQFGRRRGNETGYFAQQNAGKRGVAIDLHVPGAAEIVRRLATVADVVIENFRPGVLAGFGLDWASLSAAHPALVMLSISGFGQDGPESRRAAYAGILHAESGYLARQAEITGNRLEESQLSIADTNAGLPGLVSILAALRVRDATGEGQHIDIAMLDTMLVTDDYAYWTLDDMPAQRGSGEIWETVHGPVIVIGGFKWVWYCASTILGVVDPTPPGAELEEKIAWRRGAFAAWMLSFDDRADLLAELDRANLAWGVVRSTADALNSPTAVHRGTVAEVPDAVGGTRRVIDTPYRFSRSPSGVGGAAPRLGQHNAEVLAHWTGLADEEIAALTKAGILVAEPDDERHR